MILKNCRLLPELSGGISAERGTVVCENGKITGVFPESDLGAGVFPESGQVPGVPQAGGQAPGASQAGGLVYDCQGRTLLPGFIDAHTHIAGIRGYSAAQLKDPMSFLIQCCKNTQKYLDYGFTTIRDCGTPLRVANHVRDAYEQGLCVGPRIIASGLILSPSEIEEKDELYEIYAWADGRDANIKAARKELAEHGDFVKIMASGSALHRQGIPTQPIILKEELQAVVEVAAMKGSYVAAHAHGDGAIRLCVENGVRTIEHASYISEKTLELLKQTENCYLIPTLSAMYQNLATTPESYLYLVKKLQNMLEISAGCIRAAYEAGIPLGFGTDSTWGMDQYEEGIEFRFRKEYCGMKNLDILLQATKYSAEALGVSGLVGEIREGLAADFVLLDGKPEEDLTLLYHRPVAVFLAGELVREKGKSV